MSSRNMEKDEKSELKQSWAVTQRKWNFKHKEIRKNDVAERKYKVCFGIHPFTGEILIRYISGTRH